MASPEATASSENPVEIFVSAASSGGNGTAEAPFPDLQSAVNHIRAIRTGDGAKAVDVTVTIREGIYRLTSPIVFSNDAFAAANGRTEFRAYSGENVVVSGGLKLSGWAENADAAGLPEVAKGHIWATALPSSVTDFDAIRQMWVNGVRMKRASSFDDYSMNRIIKADKDNGKLVVPPAPPSLMQAPNLEMTIIQDWVMNFMRVDNMVSDNGRTLVTFKSPEGAIEFKRPWPILRADEASHSNHFYYFSNAIELLNRPQEWFCDRTTGNVYYWPRYNETPAGIDAVVPVVETLVDIDGTLDNPVAGIEFDGIVFEHTAWKRPAQMGHVPLQAGQFILDAYSDSSVPAGNVAYLGRPTAGIRVRNAEGISFTNCDFRHMASTGVDFESGTRNVLVQGCTFNDIGGNSILAGFFGDDKIEAHQAYNPEDKRVVCDGIKIDNNYIANTAADDWGCLAISVGFAANVNISHNEIFNTPYSAINMGWGWNKADNCMHDNHITGNYIHSFAMQMRDSGAIYTLSSQRSSSITGNRVESVGDPQFNPVMWDMRHSQFDIYTDEGSDYFTVKDNWLERGEISRNQNGSHNTWGLNNSYVSESIKNAAGLESAYLDIRKRVKQPSYAPVDSIVEVLPCDADEIDFIAPFSGFKTGNAVAVDINGDNLLDIVYSGGEGHQTKEGGVRINRGSYNFVATQPLYKVFMGNFDAGDLDGDGHIDLVQAGWDFWTSYNAILKNDGNGRLSAVDVATGKNTSPACGIADLNNDGLSDYFFIGNGTDQSFFLQNSDRSFGAAKNLLNLPGGFSDPNIVYADFNNDRNIDICILSNKTGGVYTRIFYNDGNGNFTERQVGFTEKGTRGGMAYADVNADGFIDIAIGGTVAGEQWNTPASEGGKTTTLYINNQDGTFTKSQEFSEYMADNTTQPVRFVDWNNDGHSDLILSGWNISFDNVPRTDVYLNDGNGHFTLADAGLPGASECAIEPGDFSGEGISDLLVSGNRTGGYRGFTCDRRLAVLARNRTAVNANTAPEPPSGLKAVVAGNSVEMEWGEGSDAQTPVKALTYNFYLRDVTSGKYLIFPNSDPETGKRRVSRAGNAWQNLGWKLNNLPAGTYAWSVQSVDAGYAGSAFASEQTFTVSQSGIEGVPSSASDALTIYSHKGGIDIESSRTCKVSIYTPDGKMMSVSDVNPGITSVDLAPGIYLVNTQKVAVR